MTLHLAAVVKYPLGGNPHLRLEVLEQIALSMGSYPVQLLASTHDHIDSREEILKAFCLFEDDETGKISFRNLKRVSKELDVSEELGENMTDEELQEMIDEADRDGDGEISEEEFRRITKKTSPSPVPNAASCGEVVTVESTLKTTAVGSSAPYPHPPCERLQD